MPDGRDKVRLALQGELRADDKVVHHVVDRERGVGFLALPQRLNDLPDNTTSSRLTSFRSAAQTSPALLCERHAMMNCSASARTIATGMRRRSTGTHCVRGTFG